MYKAKLKTKKLAQGMLTVVVEFFNPETNDRFEATYQTNQPQSPTWLHDTVLRQLSHLDSLPVLYSSLLNEGEDISTATVPVVRKTKAQTAKDSYKRDLAEFNKFVGALAAGFTSEVHPYFLALKKKLTDNFKSDYLDLF